ncbi:MAG: hypothetical protein Q9181_004213 [Wetmoreana brouardii]
MGSTLIPLLASWLLTGFANCRPAETASIPTISQGDLNDATCNSDPTWTAKSFLKEDCYVSVLDMFLQDYRPHPQLKFEFYSSLYPPPPESNKIQTPKRYTTKSCTLALVMLYSFNSAELPGSFRPGHAHTDMATFREIYFAAQRLERNCIVGRGQTSRLGWEPVGKSAISLFIKLASKVFL